MQQLFLVNVVYALDDVIVARLLTLSIPLVDFVPLTDTLPPCSVKSIVHCSYSAFKGFPLSIANCSPQVFARL